MLYCSDENINNINSFKRSILIEFLNRDNCIKKIRYTY